MSLLDEVVAAHGGLERWSRIETVGLNIRCGGIAFPMKGQAGPLRRTRAMVQVDRPRARIETLGTFDADEPRPAGMARRLRWTNADILHFAGYALWSYVTTPFYLVRDDVEVRELSRRRLRVTYPEGLPVHSRVQTLQFSPDCLLEHLDYAAEVFMGKFGKVRHHCLAHETVDGIVFYPCRRVVPRGLPGPTLISLECSDFEVTEKNS